MRYGGKVAAEDVLKPFKWKRTIKEKYRVTYTAYVPFGSYTVERIREDWEDDTPWEPWIVSYCFDEYYDEGQIEVGSLKEGKDFAFEDYCNRIQPALRQ